MSAAAVLATLSTFDGLGPSRMRSLLEGRTPDALWDALLDGGVLGPDVGLSPSLLAGWTAAARRTDVDAVSRRCAELDVAVVTPGHPAWPAVLDDDPEPPVVLFARGADRFDRPRIAVVGTRRCSSYGRRVAARLGSQLADVRATVVSGLALGIDAEAQRSALDRGGHVAGVVGSGLDTVYPRANSRLWNDVAEDGCLWSEWGPGTAPARWRFPARNRLVVGLSDAVVVVESAAAGGSLHTVDAALDRDVPVFAVPGPIDADSSVGTNRLLVQGCAPYTDIDDLVGLLGSHASASPSPPERRRALDPTEHDIVLALTDRPATLSDVVLVTGRDLVSVSSALSALVSRTIVSDTGGWFELT